MHPAFQPLLSRIRPLGNPARKHLRTIERHGACLLARLEAARMLSHIHLDRTAPAFSEDFALVARAAADPEEALCLLGTFYAVQFLHLNARALEQLAVDLAEESDRLASYTAFLERTGVEFSLLVSTYADHVLRLVMPANVGPFVLLNVGTASHQDDIDVAVLVGTPGGRVEIDRGIARMAAQFLRYASPFDNYVAGQVGADGFALTVEEVRDALGSGHLDFVVVTEMLRAKPLAGEAALFHRLREEVMAGYFFRPGRDNSRHELYLRGLLGETRGLLLRPPPPDRVDPKDDGLRLVLGLATALRVIEVIEVSEPGEVLGQVMVRRPELRSSLASLEESRILLETFRQVAQLVIAEEEEIAVAGDEARDNLGQVAAALGYRDWGPVQASDHLLVHYHEAIEAAREAAVALMDRVARHLTECSRFSRWTRGPYADDLAAELGTALVAAARAVRGVRFYDDLLESFSTPDGALAQAFIRSWARLPPERRELLAGLYAEWGYEAPYALLTLLRLLAARARREQKVDPVDEITAAFLDRLAHSPEAVRALSRVFRFYPELVNRFLLALVPARLERLEAVIDVPIGNPEVATARDGLGALVLVHRETSRYIKRVLARVTERHPATVQAVSDDPTLRKIALGRLAASERHPSPETQKGLLGDYYDVEFLRVALGTLRGKPEAKTRAAFGELTTTYLGRLFDFCCREVVQETGGWTFERDRLGIFLSGGNARGRPYDEDYDLVVLLDSDDPASRLFAERVIVLMNAQIARRGVISQYRLGDWLERFVVTIEELDELLLRDEDELFVDRCQLLGSKMIVGSRRVAERLVDQVLGPRVFAEAEAFSARVAREIVERRAAAEPLPADVVHLKESPGGLREIDLTLMAAKARHRLWETPGDPFVELAARNPQQRALFRGLAEVNDFLVAVRSAHRVTVAATDEIERAQLSAPARILAFPEEGIGTPGDRLFAEIRRQLAQSAPLIDRLNAIPS